MVTDGDQSQTKLPVDPPEPKGRKAQMRLLTKSDITARPVTWRNLDGRLVVRLKCGALAYELLPGEAADLARQLAAVAEEARLDGLEGELSAR